jgi:NAD(P)H-nitrite reductase large subunit
VAGSLVSATATRLLLDHEVGLHVGGTIAGIAGSGRAEGVLLQDGGVVAGDVVLCAVGAVPATDWLAGSGLDLDNGVVCDAWGAAVGADGVVAAAGDVAAWPNARFGSDPLRVEHWTNASEQGRAAARTLLHGPGHGPPHAEIPTFWSDHFGVRLQSVGLPGRADRFEVDDGDVAEGRFAAAAYAGEALVGAVAYGRPKALMALRRQLADPQHAPVLDRSPT